MFVVVSYHRPRVAGEFHYQRTGHRSKPVVVPPKGPGKGPEQSGCFCAKGRYGAQAPSESHLHGLDNGNLQRRFRIRNIEAQQKPDTKGPRLTIQSDWPGAFQSEAIPISRFGFSRSDGSGTSGNTSPVATRGRTGIESGSWKRPIHQCLLLVVRRRCFFHYLCTHHCYNG